MRFKDKSPAKRVRNHDDEQFQPMSAPGPFCYCIRPHGRNIMPHSTRVFEKLPQNVGIVRTMPTNGISGKEAAC